MSDKLSDSDRERLRSQCEHRPSLDSGSFYEGCTQGDINDYIRMPDRDQPLRSMNWKLAMRKLYTFLDPNSTPSPEILSALKRLENAMWSKTWGPDIILKGAHDLDTAFFNGKLRENFGVQWGTTASMMRDVGRPVIGSLYGTTHFGYPSTDSAATCMITLNSDTIFDDEDPNELMWHVLVHELVHAYIDIFYDSLKPLPFDVAQGERYNDGHGFHFRFILNLIYLRSDSYLGGFLHNKQFRWGPDIMSRLPSLVTQYLEASDEDLDAFPMLEANACDTTAPKINTLDSSGGTSGSKDGGTVDATDPVQGKDGGQSCNVQ